MITKRLMQLVYGFAHFSDTFQDFSLYFLLHHLQNALKRERDKKRASNKSHKSLSFSLGINKDQS